MMRFIVGYHLLLWAMSCRPLLTVAQFTDPFIPEDTGTVLSSQNISAPSFIGQPFDPKPIALKHRYTPDVVGFHQDGGNTRTNDWDGPLGEASRVESRSVPMSALYWHTDGRLTARSVCDDGQGAYVCIGAFGLDSFDKLGSWAPKGDILHSPYATVLGSVLLIPSLQGHIFEIERIDSENGTSFRQLRDIDLASTLPQGYSGVSSYYDEEGNVWFTAVRLQKTGTVDDSGILGFATKEGSIHTRTIFNQTIENSIAVSGRTVYLNTGPLLSSDERNTGHMFAFQADSDGNIEPIWTETYRVGSVLKPGALSQGSGSTPALVGDKYVVMTDNADSQVNLVVYKQFQDKSGSNLVCEVPLFEPGKSANGNAMIGYYDGSTYSVVINNNHGAKELQSMSEIEDINCEFNEYSPLAPGITRVDISEEGECKVRWNLKVRSTSVVSLSTATGLVYSYTQDEELAKDGGYVWYFTAIDFETGKLACKVRAGAGGNFNNNFAPTQMSPHGAIYQVVVGGIAWLSD
ncbi:hypothetical protein FALBO_10597 [Fusarium albosuccineum]|uniref:Uncharacterized protein n=1 Tax=Fusarium albosuccineum TaxID=1237068 RepID=A0A8H4P7Y7_9HYPO|nr:hypothetical protein FALBO_10597 [Fusarium albosuccineum]